MKAEIEESSSVRLLSRPSSGGVGESRWVDGSEVDSESPPWSLLGDEQNIREGYGYIRRRLAKKPKRVDSFDVEAMEIAGAHGHHNKVTLWFDFFKFLYVLNKLSTWYMGILHSSILFVKWNYDRP